MSLHVEVVSPERILWSGEATMVIARTVGGGEIAFLTGHAPFVGALDIAPVQVRPEDGPEVLVAVHGGFVEVSNDRVTILSDVAELADQIDEARGRASLEAAEGALRDDPADEAAVAAKRRAEVRLRVAGGVTAGSGH